MTHDQIERTETLLIDIATTGAHIETAILYIQHDQNERAIRELKRALGCCYQLKVAYLSKSGPGSDNNGVAVVDAPKVDPESIRELINRNARDLMEGGEVLDLVGGDVFQFFRDEAHAQNAYQLLRTVRQPGTAQEMRDAWVAEVRARQSGETTITDEEREATDS